MDAHYIAERHRTNDVRRAYRQKARRVMAVVDAEQAELRAEVERLTAELASTIEDYTEAVQNFGRERIRVSRAEALANHLDTLAPGDRYYAGRIRAALDGPEATTASSA